jgi:hypothetical protein
LALLSFGDIADCRFQADEVLVDIDRRRRCSFPGKPLRVAEPRVLVLNRFQERLLDELLTGQPKEESMKLAILGIMVGALVVADFVAIGRIAMVIGELAKRR